MRETKYPDNNGDMGAALYDFLPANAYLISSEHPIYSWSQCKPAVSKKKKKKKGVYFSFKTFPFSHEFDFSDNY